MMRFTISRMLLIIYGEQKLEQAKQEANDQLNHLNDLTNEQKLTLNH